MSEPVLTHPSEEGLDINYPALQKRIQASFIDMMVLIGLAALLSQLFEAIGPITNLVRIASFVALFVLYEPILVSLGATVGQLLMKIRVRRFSDRTKRINVFASLLRYLIKAVLGWLSFLTIGSSNYNRAIHDMAVDSVVVEK